jgi:hypothetical protein
MHTAAALGEHLMTTYNTNLAAEFYVLSMLHRLGADAALTLGNKKAVDIIVTNEGRTITIDVKGLAGPYDWPADNIQVFQDTQHFYVLVSFEHKITDPLSVPSAWIIPANVLSQYIRKYKTRAVISRAEVKAKGQEFLHAWPLITERTNPLTVSHTVSSKDQSIASREVADMRKIILISCVSQKLAHIAKAGFLYTSPLFKKSLAYAQSLNPDAIYILSAKYGLVELDQEIEPYDLTLNHMSADQIKTWAARVLAQLSEKADLRQDHFIFLAGQKYRQYLLPKIKSYEIPLKGLPIGKQLQFLSKTK